MTLQEMYDELEMRLQQYDTDREWTPLQLVQILNRAQRIAVAKVPAFLVPELTNIASAQDITSGYFDISGLDPLPLFAQAGIVSVKHSGGKYVDLISWENQMQNSDDSATYTSQHPKMWWRGNLLYVRPYSGYTIDILYKAEPTTMALPDTACALSDAMEDVILEIAEARAVRGIDRIASRQIAAHASDMIEEYSSGYAPIENANLEVVKLYGGASSFNILTGS